MILLNAFFRLIIAVQRGLENFENWYMKKKTFFSSSSLACLVLASILGPREKNIAAIIFLWCCVCLGIENVIGWKYSVRKWLKMGIFCNFVFALILTGMIHKQLNLTFNVSFFVECYLLLWMFISLVSNSKVALLVNEVIAGLVTTIFTVGTYITSLPISEKYYSVERLDSAIIKQESLIWEFVKISSTEDWSIFFLAFLPIIGVTAFSIIMIKIKIYWMEKNHITEPEQIMLEI